MSVLKLYQPLAYANNTLVIHKSKSGCCNDTVAFCKSQVEATITNVTSITINTVDGPLPIVFADGAANTPREVRVAIAKALKTAGYDPYYCDNWKGVTVEADRICIIGEVEVLTINVDGVEEAVTKLCTTGRVCKYRETVEYDTDLGLLSVDGSAGTQIGTIAGFAAGDVAGLKAALETALTTEGATFTKVEVIEEAAAASFVYTIHLSGEQAVLIGGAALSQCGCYPEFISA